jgi:hypothetical protein
MNFVKYFFYCIIKKPSTVAGSFYHFSDFLLIISFREKLQEKMEVENLGDHHVTVVDDTFLTGAFADRMNTAGAHDDADCGGVHGTRTNHRGSECRVSRSFPGVHVMLGRRESCRCHLAVIASAHAPRQVLREKAGCVVLFLLSIDLCHVFFTFLEDWYLLQKLSPWVTDRMSELAFCKIIVGFLFNLSIFL